MCVRKFFRNSRGNAAILFAATVFPLAGLAAGSVEYARISDQWTEMQAASDSAALKLTTLAVTASQADLQKAAATIVTGMISNEAVRKSLNVSATRSSAGVQVTAAGQMPTPFASLIGYATRPVSVTSSATRSGPRRRIALVLDLTQSMGEDGKFPAMQRAAINFITKLQSTTQGPGDTYVSLIPFTTTVNVGKSNYNQPWVRWNGSGDTWDETMGRCSDSDYKTRAACWNKRKTWTPTAHSAWNGCVMDRDPNYDVTNVAPTFPAAQFPAFQDPHCTWQAIPLSENWAGLRSYIGYLTYGSEGSRTNQEIGFAHGWASLGGSIYPVPALDPAFPYEQSIVMLSDGLNTQNRWYSWYRDKNDRNHMDWREGVTCDNIKAAGIKIFTVQINTGGDALSNVLKYCASDASKFYHVTSASQTDYVLQYIATSLTTVGSPRLTQ